MAFAPGQSGNPGGKPKRAKLFTNALLAALKRTDENNVEAIQRIADRMVKHAMESEDFDTACVREIADRVEGKVPQGIAGDDENPLTLIHRIERIIVDKPPDTNGAGVPSAPPAG